MARKKKGSRRKSKKKTKTTARKLSAKKLDDLEAKIDLVAAMSASLGKLTQLEMRLRFTGNADGADAIKKKHAALRREIDQLRGQVADDWGDGVADLRDRLRSANAKVQASIRDIKKQIEVAKNVEKVLGLVDGAVKVVRDLVP